MYTKQEWNNGTRLDAMRLMHIEDGIYDCSLNIEKLKEEAAKIADFNKMIEDVFVMMQKHTDEIEKLKKENTALKTKLTKLSNKNAN